MRTTPELRRDARESLGQNPHLLRGVVVDGLNLESALLYDLEETLSGLAKARELLEEVRAWHDGDDESVRSAFGMVPIVDRIRAFLRT